ncbi:hypothetical protein [Chryseobacterium salviniae]|uniref:Uncharacterized protein n=1 Tax=Chryseobacterium salviniae TaxID=3101750 RepID=A0ABU6HXI1_9FLAO|nr:hypothetical protein [Chryseobacterium sp. T9W2-O]MEC3876682.1 hypothetical protein [Chryseobacterium sp. T9W2-O]
MTPKELYEIVVSDFPINIHPLHKAIMEECCENAINNPQKIEDKDTLLYAVRVAFLTSDSALKGTLLGVLQSSDTEVIILNYREQSFEIKKDSGILK